MCVSSSIIIYKKMISISKSIKHNWVNNPCCKIKYLDLYLSLIFLILFLFIVNDFFYLHKWF